MEHQTKKCYNSFSCILSILIMIFMMGSIIYDMAVSKPAIRKNIDEIKVEIQEVNKKIDI